MRQLEAYQPAKREAVRNNHVYDRNAAGVFSLPLTNRARNIPAPVCCTGWPYNL
jgi:hypothetical protein